MAKPQKMPVLFVGHGSPMVAVENDGYTKALEKLGKNLPKPELIVVVSAHWESNRPIRVTGSINPELIYDFFGFPSELYQLNYPCSGHPEWAKKIVSRLSKEIPPALIDNTRGIDHGAWIPLLRIYPQANIPVIQITLPFPRQPEEIFGMGKLLAPLREDGVLLVGSGNLVHNLRLVDFEDKAAPIDAWAKAMDDWLTLKIGNYDLNSLFEYRTKAPHADMGAETSEHFDPLFFSLGAASDLHVSTVFEGFHYGNLSMRTFIID